MRILAIADVEDRVLAAHLAHVGTRYYDVVVSCGDLGVSYLDYVTTMANAQLLYVRGNHDVGFETNPPGGIDLHGHVVEVGGVRFAGLEGSLAYREGIVGYTQAQMRRQVLRLEALARLHGGIDVLVTHAPARGEGDLEDLPHQGFEAFNGLLRREKPQLMLHGHVHLDYGLVRRERTHASGTRIVNAFGYRTIEL